MFFFHHVISSTELFSSCQITGPQRRDHRHAFHEFPDECVKALENPMAPKAIETAMAKTTAMAKVKKEHSEAGKNADHMDIYGYVYGRHVSDVIDLIGLPRFTNYGHLRC